MVKLKHGFKIEELNGGKYFNLIRCKISMSFFFIQCVFRRQSAEEREVERQAASRLMINLVKKE